MTITGEKGKIYFTVFDDNDIYIELNNEIQKITFETLEHVQQPMIAAVTNYFLGKEENPCSGEEGLKVMEWMDLITV